jgi:XTP/dITP diphosphohydrolase
MRENIMQIILASNNQHKIDELSAILSSFGLPISLISQKTWFKGNPPEIEETGSTLEENALLKAKALFEMTSLPVIADDTGLEVYALDNAPGVFSARYAGDHGNDVANRRKLLHEMNGISERSARFRTVLHFLNDETSMSVDGVCEGQITTIEKGDNGFGYDALFIPDGSSMTFAEMDAMTKHSMSHRARACHALGKTLAAYVKGNS